MIILRQNLLFSLISIFIICTAGCTIPFNENENNEEYRGCAPGEEHTEDEESCTIEEQNEDEEISLFDNNTETEENNSPTENNTGNEENNTGNEEENTGIYEGMHVPNFQALIHYYNTSTWEEFELYSLINETWNSTENNDSKWITLIFVSTDCSHCWYAGDDLSEWAATYNNKTQFMVLAVNFSSNNNFNATPEEVIAFQEKNDYFGCYSNTKNCNERPGDPHEFPYIDDRNQSIMYNWEVTGTPSYFIIQPNGIMAWNINQHKSSNNGDGENINQALERLFG